RRPADMGVARAHIALLVAAETDAAAARLADVAGGERDVHQRAVGPVVVVAPDQALLVADHGAATLAAVLRHGDPLGRLDDVGGVETGDLRRFLDARPAPFEGALEAGQVAGLVLTATARRVEGRPLGRHAE